MDQQHRRIATIGMADRLGQAQIAGGGKDALQGGFLEGQEIIGSGQPNHAADGAPLHPGRPQKIRVQGEHGGVIGAGGMSHEHQ